MKNLLPFERKKREVLVRKESETDGSFGRKPEERTVEELIGCGIINLDKPSGPSSHQTSAYVKQILGIAKSGHSGTLDPKVTGVLPVALGKATRIAEVLLTSGKEYVCLMQLHRDVEEEKIRKTCGEFVGRIKQLPPVKSAVVRRIRERKIHYLEILDVEERFVLFRVGCQAGTYIRKLVSDIGSRMGGAHMLELRRTKAGPFSEENSFTLQDVKDALHFYREEGNDRFIRKAVQPIEAATRHLPRVWAADNAIDSVCHGSNLKAPGVGRLESGFRKGDTVVVMSLKGELVCYGIAGMDASRIHRSQMGVAVKPDAVFMAPGTYPKAERR